MPALERLVVKPTLECTARCPTCSGRLALFEERRAETPLPFEAWRAVLADAGELGCLEVHVSGGEPTLYPGLDDLVRFASDLGMRTNVNTNGSPVTAELAPKLRRAGLGSITLSIYSPDPAVHDEMRREPGLFARALEAARLLGREGLALDLQTLLGERNLLDLDRLLELAYELRAGHLYLSYLEGDVKGRWLPAAGSIRRFRSEVLPRILEVVEARAPGSLRDEATRAAASLFSGTDERIEEYARGLYHPSGVAPCDRPSTFALVLANGDVLPCNGVEYSHEPIMGNVRRSPLPALWTSPAWREYRRSRGAWCRRCPMPLHLRIPVLGGP